MADNNLMQNFIDMLQGAGAGWLGDVNNQFKRNQAKQDLQMRLEQHQQEKEKNSIMA
jgi:hypothetical protein